MKHQQITEKFLFLLDAAKFHIKIYEKEALTVKPLCSYFEKRAEFVQRIPNCSIEFLSTLCAELMLHLFCTTRQPLWTYA